MCEVSNITAQLRTQGIRDTMVMVKIAQSCPTLCNPVDYTIHGILQARILEWVAFPFSRGSSQPRDWNQVSHIASRFFTSWATREAQSGHGLIHIIQKVAQPRSYSMRTEAEPWGREEIGGTACLLSHFSRVWLSVTLWSVACQAPLSMEFSRREYWSGLQFPPRGDLPQPSIQLVSSASPAWQVISLSTEPPGKPRWQVISLSTEPLGKPRWW